MKAHQRVLAILLLIGLSVHCMQILFRPATPLELFLERELRNSSGGSQPSLIQVRESSPGVLQVQLPLDKLKGNEKAASWLPYCLVSIWRKQPTAPELLEVTIQHFHVACRMSTTSPTGRQLLLPINPPGLAGCWGGV